MKPSFNAQVTPVILIGMTSFVCYYNLVLLSVILRFRKLQLREKRKKRIENYMRLVYRGLPENYWSGPVHNLTQTAENRKKKHVY